MQNITTFILGKRRSTSEKRREHHAIYFREVKRRSTSEKR
jgi:hypothetical protein